MSFEKPKFFEDRKSFIWSMLFLFVILCIRLAFEYQSYKEFVSKPFYFTEANVINAYKKTKNGRQYTVLKLHTDEGYTFYTTTHLKQNFLRQHLRIQIFPTEEIPFYKYLGTFYIKSQIKSHKIRPATVKDALLKRVNIQHEDATLGSFYNAIFFATAIEKSLRDKIALLGVSHLVALSGFHLGILWALVYGLLLFPYKKLQQRFFPYRHALFDVGLVTLFFLGIYVWFVDFPPSLVRSYAMVFMAWLMLIMGIELLSFEFLANIVMTLLALFPSLLVSLGFWLSVSGVFYIFLLLYYAKNLNKWWITLVLIPVGIFLFMLPVVHGIFDVTSSYQLLSPLLSLLFILFYPLSIVLYLIGYGGVFDTELLWLFSLPSEVHFHLLPWWISAGYIVLSLFSVWSKKAFYLTIVLAFGYGIYLFL